MQNLKALEEVTAMWTWLYKHPAHDRKYYETFVAELDRQWKNDCPICSQTVDACPDCPLKWEEQNGTFCSDPESPLRKWMATPLNEPDFRTLYSGEIIAIAQNAIRRLAAT